MVSFLHTSSTTTWSPFSHWRRHNINSKKPRAISYAYHILPHLKYTNKILTYYFINSKRKNGRGKPLSYKRQLNLGLGSGYRRREHAVLVLPYFIRGRRWGAEIGDCVVVAVLVYSRVASADKKQKVLLFWKKSATLFNLITTKEAHKQNLCPSLYFLFLVVPLCARPTMPRLI